MTDVEQAINSDQGKIDKWYEENKMRRNHDNCKAMIMDEMDEMDERRHETLLLSVKAQASLWQRR